MTKLPAAEFITHDFRLPDHKDELCKAEALIEKFKHRLKIIQIQRRIDGKMHTEFFEEIIRVLDYVGRLSKSVFDIEDEMELQYIKNYPKSPELAKKLFNDHYEYLHHPYTILKNRCFKLLEELDAEYYKQHKKRPPNWNI
jgi:hypothetical protein